MLKYTLVGHVFEFEDNAYQFFVRYIVRIEAYAAAYGIADDVVTDIKYSIIEKLYRYESPVAEAQVIEIANTLGEPEVIFDETDSDEGKTDFFKRKFLIDKEKPLIRGVCFRLSKKLNVNVRIMRLIFLILILFNGTGLLLYGILALFAPFKDKKLTTGRLGSLVFEIVRIGLWLFLLSMLLPLTFGATVFTGLLFFTPALDNQSFTAWIPQYMYGVSSAALIALIVLAIGAVGALFKKRRIANSFALLATIIVIIAGLITAGTAYKTVMLGINHTKIVDESFVLSGSSVDTQVVDISVGKPGTSHDDFNIPTTYSVVKLVPISGENITVQVSTTLRGISDEIIAHSATKLSPLQISEDGNAIAISRPSPLFSEEVPFPLMNTFVTIGVPTDKEVRMSLGAGVDMSVRKRFTEATPDGGERIGYCDGTIYVYNAVENEFVCKNIIWHEEVRESSFDERGDYTDAYNIPQDN